MNPRQYEHPSSRRDQAKYADQAGEEAAARQIDEAKERFYCCGELRADGHHPFCSKVRDQEQPEHIDGQESLL